MNDAQIAKLRELEAISTNGPWVRGDSQTQVGIIAPTVTRNNNRSPKRIAYCGPVKYSDLNEEDKDNADFICLAKTVVPELIDEFYRLHYELTKSQAIILDLKQQLEFFNAGRAAQTAPEE